MVAAREADEEAADFAAAESGEVGREPGGATCHLSHVPVPLTTHSPLAASHTCMARRYSLATLHSPLQATDWPGCLLPGEEEGDGEGEEITGEDEGEKEDEEQSDDDVGAKVDELKVIFERDQSNHEDFDNIMPTGKCGVCIAQGASPARNGSYGCFSCNARVCWDPHCLRDHLALNKGNTARPSAPLVRKQRQPAMGRAKKQEPFH
jgi:hypothetical protein